MANQQIAKNPRKNAYRRLHLQYLVTRILTDHKSITATVPELLRAICENDGWDMSELWLIEGGSGVLRLQGMWQSPEVPPNQIKSLSKGISFAPGEGIPGTVLAVGRPVYIEDLDECALFVRTQAALDLHLRTGFGFPIRSRDQVMGAVVLFNQKARRLSRATTEMYYTVGSQIGSAFEHKRAEEALQQSEEQYRSMVTAIDSGIVWMNQDGAVVACNEAAERILGMPCDQLIGRTSTAGVWNVIHQDGSTFPEENLPGRVTLRTGRPCSNVVLGFFKPGENVTWLSVNSRALFKAGESRPYAVVTSLTDITARKQAEQTLQRHATSLEVLLRTSEQINTVLEIPVIMRKLVGAGMKLTGGTAGMYGLLQHEEMVFSEFNDQGRLCPIECRFAKGVGAAGQVMETLQPYLTNDLERDPCVLPELRDSLNFYNLVSVPILNRQRKLLGCFEILNKPGKGFDLRDVTRMQALAASAAIALENAEMLVELESAAKVLRRNGRRLRRLLEEREQLFRDLHDNVMQSIYAVTLGLEDCRYTLEADPLSGVKKVETAIANLNVVIRDVRHHVLESGASLSGARSLEAELARLNDTVLGLNFDGFDMDLSQAVLGALSPEEADHLLLIAREAMANVLKHSGARKARVRLVWHRGSIQLDVSDQGRGFDPLSSEARRGFGLRNIAARARRLKASLHITARPGAGVQIRVVFRPRRKTPAAQREGVHVQA